MNLKGVENMRMHWWWFWYQSKKQLKQCKWDRALDTSLWPDNREGNLFFPPHAPFAENNHVIGHKGNVDYLHEIDELQMKLTCKNLKSTPAIT